MAEIEHTGRCLCGAIRFRVTGAPEWIGTCHCESCRRATASPATTFAGFATARFEYVAGQPQTFHSSPGVTRSFCGRCGTPLTYESERWPGKIDVFVCAMDRLEDFPPDRHSFVEEKLSWLDRVVPG